jgi:hypothetical protein
MPMRRLGLLLVAATIVTTVLRPAALERPLPELQPFLQEVRKHLQPDDSRQSSYMFVTTERRWKLDGRGRPSNESVTIGESYPGFAPGEDRWRRVLEEDGKRVPEAALQKKDAERRKRAEVYAGRLQDPRERAKLARARENDRREAAETVDDAFRVYEIAMLGRESIDGHDTIALSMTPRPRAAARTREGRWLRAFKGRAWISESDYELVKLEVEAIDTISMGLGMLARMHKGSTAAFSRRKVNGETWLPSRAEYQFSARVLMIRSMRERGTVEFSNYLKFGVETSTTIATPKTMD